MLGFPVALLLAWAYELTPEGVRRTKSLPLAERITRINDRKLNFVIISLLSMAVLFLVADQYVFDESTPESAESVTEVRNDSANPAVLTVHESVLPNSVAVLPLANLSPDPDNAFFAAGIHESILNQLAKVAGINVIARTSMLRYAETGKTIPEIAAELNVQTILEGSVRYANDRVLVTAQLIDPGTSAHIWSEEYDRPLNDIFAIQTDVAIRIARALRAELSVSERQNIERVPTPSANAYQLYLRGRFHWNVGQGIDFARSVDYYNQALQLDPDFALAHAGLADAYTLMIGIGDLAPDEYWPRAIDAAARALELDPQLSEAWAARALIRHFYEWDFESGDRDFAQAIALSPSSATAHQLYGKNLPNTLQFDRGAEEVSLALKMDPYSVSANKDLGEVFYFARRYDEAIEQFERTLTLEPGYPPALFWLTRCYEATGRQEQAIDYYNRLYNSGDDSPPTSESDQAFQQSGWEGYWRERVNGLHQALKTRHIEPFSFVEHYVRIGNRDAAFEWLEISFQSRSGWIATAHIDPLMDSIRSDPRFADLLRRTGTEKWAR
jgi:TolB-like protein/tetratricopeptide (TPR) repeat protein